MRQTPKILIVGATGQVGRQLIRLLARRSDVEVTGVSRNYPAAAPLIYDGLDIKITDILDPVSAKSVFNGFDII